MEEQYYEQIAEWYKNDNKRVFIVSGYAGCGKTTLARLIPDKLKLSNVAFLTPTGVAATILSSGARTIHSYMYEVSENPVTKELIFMKKSWGDFNEDLLIVDEISMVSEELLTDLRELNIPIIGLGDPQQLPPVNGQSTILNEPDIFLTKVYRQDGGILDLATDIRLRNPLKKEYNDVIFKARSIFFDLKLIVDNSIVICRFNKTRRKLNEEIRRRVYGYDMLINVHERLMILNNDRETGLSNGSIVEVLRITYASDYVMKLDIKSFDGSLLSIYITTHVLRGIEKPKNMPVLYDGKKKIRLFDVDYAYAITCHKSQGNEFDNVFIVREGQNFEDWDRWFYTAVTRAKKKLYIY